MGALLQKLYLYLLSKTAYHYGLVFLNTPADENLKKSYWEKHAPFWSNYRVPTQPSKEDISHYKSFLENCGKNASRILLLGATPALRDLLAEYYSLAQILIADYSPAMFFYTTRALKKADPNKEIWVKTDWLELPFPDGYFDLILGDRILEQFSPQTQEKFLIKIKNLLAENGSLIMRCRCLNEDVKNKSPQEIFNDTLVAHKNQMTYDFANTLIGRLKDAFTDPISLCINYELVINSLKNLVKKNGKGEELQNAYKNFIKDGGEFPFQWTHSVPPKNELLSSLQKYFSQKSIAFSSDYTDASFYPIIHFKNL